MKITFFSNFFNHHQKPFCDYLYQQLKDDFRFVATEEVPKERIDLGYQNEFSDVSYLLESYLGQDQFNEALTLGESSDVVIIGSAPEIFIRERLKLNKLTFRYSERLLKKGLLYYINPKAFIKRYQRDTKLRKKNIHLLAASAYAPLDYSLYFSYPNKMYQFGYFPKMMTYPMDQLMKFKQHEKVKILWVGRFLDWKRPKDAVIAVKKLIDLGHKVSLDMIGVGPEYQKIEKLIKKYGLVDIKLHGSVSSGEVRKYMDQANIFLQTSNRNEGWGAVLNEAMNSACLCISHYQVGAAPYLITHNKNGVLYKNRDDLIKKLIYFLYNPKESNKLGKAAYKTIKEEWNHDIAGLRFIKLCQGLLNGQKNTFDHGPLSKAFIIKESKMKRKCS